jgi:hypothetical protein
MELHAIAHWNHDIAFDVVVGAGRNFEVCGIVAALSELEISRARIRRAVPRSGRVELRSRCVFPRPA